MGEAKRKRRAAANRSWATGSIKIEANKQECFDWSGTREQAIDLQERYLEAANLFGGCHSYAVRGTGYLMCYGMPRAGDPDHRPSSMGGTWDDGELELLKVAVLWLVLREHIPHTGQRVEDVFVGKELVVWFTGDRKEILDSTERELNGVPFDLSKQFEMKVVVLSYHHRLDPGKAVSMPFSALAEMAGLPELSEETKEDQIYIPRVPLNADEAKAMLNMLIIFVDGSKDAMDAAAAAGINPADLIIHYAGYTNDELRGGKPAVIVRNRDTD
jgi:hypothetical protein